MNESDSNHLICHQEKEQVYFPKCLTVPLKQGLTGHIIRFAFFQILETSHNSVTKQRKEALDILQCMTFTMAKWMRKYCAGVAYTRFWPISKFILTALRAVSIEKNKIKSKFLPF